MTSSFKREENEDYDYEWDEPEYEMFLFGKAIRTVGLPTFFTSFVSFSPSQNFLIIDQVDIYQAPTLIQHYRPTVVGLNQYMLI